MKKTLLDQLRHDEYEKWLLDFAQGKTDVPCPEPDISASQVSCDLGNTVLRIVLEAKG